MRLFNLTHLRPVAALSTLVVGLILALEAPWPAAASPRPDDNLTPPTRVYPSIPRDDDDEDCPTDEEITSQPFDPDSPASLDPSPCPSPEECPPGFGGEDCAGLGMPVWRVSEPYINLWVKDVPLYYTLSNGRLMPFVLRYRQRGSALSTNTTGFGDSWECSWLGYFEVDETDNVSFRVPGGGKRQYGPLQEGAIRGRRSEQVTATLGPDGTPSFHVQYRSFCAGVYDKPFAGTNATTLHLLSEKTDRHGRTLRFQYSTNQSMILLSRVIDYDGKASTLFYTNRAFPRFVTSVRDPYGREAKLHYDTNGHLIRIIDMQGITNAFRYDTNGFLSAFVTPYGTTTFQTTRDPLDDTRPLFRSIQVTLPDGSREAFAYHDSLSTRYVPEYCHDTPMAPDEVPEPALFGPLNSRNSFHWTSRQLSRIGHPWPEFEPADYRLARWRHWDARYTDGGIHIDPLLRIERSPSPDALQEGHRRWYSYFFDPVSLVKTRWPSQVAERLPDGTARYTQWLRNEWGLVTASLSSRIDDGSPCVCYCTYTYDGTERNLVEVRGPELDELVQPVLVRSYTYTDRNQIRSSANALNETTEYLYHAANGNLISASAPYGLRLTNTLAADGFVTQRTWFGPGNAPLATNQFSWAQGKVATFRTARGLTLRHFWDALGRLTGQVYPDGTFLTNTYTRLDGKPFPNSTGGLQLLDCTQTRDRTGQTTRFEYNPLRNISSITNALDQVTRYAWCDCGGLESITDPLGNVTSFEYDLGGRLLAVHEPGAHTVRATWNLLGQPVRLETAHGAASLAYNHQGLCTAITNALGNVQIVEYDVLDRPAVVRSSDGQGYRLAYDAAGRLRQRASLDGLATEDYAYTPGVPWPVARTNQPGNRVALLSYDPFGRVTRQVFATLENTAVVPHATNRFAYSPAGDVVSVTDPRGYTTRWIYDAEGRPLRKVNASNQTVYTNAFNANGAIVAHWSPTLPSPTRLEYDPLGNLARIDLPRSTDTDVQFTYDANNRPVSMTDAVGTTRFAWTAFNTLALEDGPWPNDTVTYQYADDRLLAALTLEQPNAAPWTQSYQVDPTGTLVRLTSPAGVFGYEYSEDRLQITATRLPNGAAVTNTYDPLGRLIETVLLNAQGGVLNRHGYTYNALDQRITHALADGNLFHYDYDPAGRLSAASGSGPDLDVALHSGGDSTLRLHEQFAYEYDAAGNLRTKTHGNATLDLAVDPLNRILTAARSPNVTVSGATTGDPIEVTVNGLGAALYPDGAFACPNVPVPAGANRLEAVARDADDRTATDVAYVNLPGSARFQYDADGNLIADGWRALAYDSRGQLATVTCTNPPAPPTRSEFVYDGLGRKRVVREFTWADGQWQPASETRYVYSGMLALQCRDAENLPTLTLTRGLDLAAGLQSAGGIGGLLALTDHQTATPTHYYYHADALGNVTALTDARQQIVARYAYDPFGNLLAQQGPTADLNPFRFSSKELHAPSGLYDYTFRFYDPALQRWLNPDPIGESGGLNLYEFCGNAGTDYVDRWGLRGVPARPRPVDFEMRDPINAELSRCLERGGWVDTLRPETRETLLNRFREGWTGTARSINAPRTTRRNTDRLTEPEPPREEQCFPDKAEADRMCESLASGWPIYRRGKLPTKPDDDSDGSRTKGFDWSTLDPVQAPVQFVRKFGLPPNNSSRNPDWVITATLRPGAPFKIEPAPPIWPNAGAWLQVTVPNPENVVINSFRMYPYD